LNWVVALVQNCLEIAFLVPYGKSSDIIKVTFATNVVACCSFGFNSYLEEAIIVECVRKILPHCGLDQGCS
jgi:hypothetical protein